jgi:hypothetical protein
MEWRRPNVSRNVNGTLILVTAIGGHAHQHEWRGCYGASNLTRSTKAVALFDTGLGRNPEILHFTRLNSQLTCRMDLIAGYRCDTEGICSSRFAIRNGVAWVNKR